MSINVDDLPSGRVFSTETTKTRATATAGTGTQTIVRGPPGPPGPPGTSGAGYTHLQTIASMEWLINHNLGFRPAVLVYNAGSVEVEAEVIHLSVNTVRVLFLTDQSGFARLT